jgi:hypothetical protein
MIGNMCGKVLREIEARTRFPHYFFFMGKVYL